MQKITPFLWFDNNAEEAVNLYTSIFKNSKVGSIARYGEAGPGPVGTVMTATFQLAGQEFTALNGGPEYQFTPAISFFVYCQSQAEIDDLWTRLSEGGTVLMELAKYPFSEKFGWVNDKFGVSWQLNFVGLPQKITPYLMFVGKQHGKAEQAINEYVSLFKNSSISQIERFGAGEGEPAGSVKHARFILDHQEFIALESSMDHHFTFTPAISFYVDCKTQPEVDQLWEKLSEGGEKGPCGWLVDKYGISWQIVPSILPELLADKDAKKSQRVMKAMLQMQKIDIEKLKMAYEQG
jgi:predicted 3-demethylubiquinone-9 3-methyltransferase (glyoxalase superfamily)